MAHMRAHMAIRAANDRPRRVPRQAPGRPVQWPATAPLSESPEPIWRGGWPSLRIRRLRNGPGFAFRFPGVSRAAEMDWRNGRAGLQACAAVRMPEQIGGDWAFLNECGDLGVD